MSRASGAGTGGRRVTIRSMSCRGVKAFVPFQKPPLYAAVSLGGRREKTPPDTDGGENPDWEGAVVAFDLDGDGQQEQLVRFEVKAQVPLLGHKLVGTASVPLADLEAGDGAAPRHVSYQVRAPDGKPNGSLSFAYAISSAAGGARPQPQLNSVPDGAPPEQNSTFSCAPPPPPPAVTAYPPPSTANFAPHGGGGYPPPPSSAAAPVSGSLYPALQDLLPSSTYPPPPGPPSTLPYPAIMSNPHFPEPNSSSYPPPPAAPHSVYPPPPDSYTARPAPPAHHISSYPPQPPPPTSSYPPPPPSGYPPPLSNLAPPTSTYPPPPPESVSVYPVLPRSAPSPSSSTVDHELPYYPAPPGGSYYPSPRSHHPELDGAARTSYYYPPSGSRYP